MAFHCGQKGENPKVEIKKIQGKNIIAEDERYSKKRACIIICILEPGMDLGHNYNKFLKLI